MLETLLAVRRQRLAAASARQQRTRTEVRSAANGVENATAALAAMKTHCRQEQARLDRGYQGQQVNINTLLQWQTEETRLSEEVQQAREQLEQARDECNQAVERQEDARRNCRAADRQCYKAEYLLNHLRQQEAL